MSYHRGIGAMTTDEAIKTIQAAAVETGGAGPSAIPKPSLPIGLAVVAAAALGYYFLVHKKKRGA
jgi:hypothetical protein